MYDLYYYTAGEVREIIKSMVVLVDTREQSNKHITDYLASKNIAYVTRALPAADYSVMLPKNEEIGILRDIYLNLDRTNGILIERKNSLEELAGNLGRNRERFENELEKMKGAEKHLIVESGSWKAVYAGEYNSDVTSASFRGSLFAFQSRYGLHVHFADRETSPKLIVDILARKIKEILHV